MDKIISTESGLGKSKASGTRGVSESSLSPMGQSKQAMTPVVRTDSAGDPVGWRSRGPMGVRGRDETGGKERSASGASAERLGNSTNKTAPAGQSDFGSVPNTSKSQGNELALTGQSREELRSTLQRITNLPRLRRCGTRPVQQSSVVTVRWSPEQRHLGGSSFSGLQSCESWACPTCAARLSIAHQLDVHAVLNGAVSAGHGVLLLTLTMKHRLGQSLESLWDAASDGWSAVMNTKHYRHPVTGDKAVYGIAGWIRSTEVTYGANGWHVHLHVALIVPRNISDDKIDALGGRLFSRWQTKLSKLGYTPDNRHGFKIDRSFSEEGIAAYVTKSGQALYGASAELSQSQTKFAGKKSRTTWQVLQDVAQAQENGDIEAYERNVAVWREWESVQAGRRRLAMSRRLRDQFYEVAESSAVEIDTETGMPWFHVASLPREEWKNRFAKNLPLQQFVREELTRAMRLSHARQIWVDLADAMGIAFIAAETDLPLEAKPLPELHPMLKAVLEARPRVRDLLLADPQENKARYQIVINES